MEAAQAVGTSWKSNGKQLLFVVVTGCLTARVVKISWKVSAGIGLLAFMANKLVDHFKLKPKSVNNFLTQGATVFAISYLCGFCTKTHLKIWQVTAFSIGVSIAMTLAKTLFSEPTIHPKSVQRKTADVWQDKELRENDSAQALKMNKMRKIIGGNFVSRYVNSFIFSPNTPSDWVRISDAFSNQNWDEAIDLLHTYEKNPKIKESLLKMQTGTEEEWRRISSLHKCGSRSQLIHESALRVMRAEMKKWEDLESLTFQTFLATAYLNRAIQRHDNKDDDQMIVLDLARARIYSQLHGRGCHKLVWGKISEFELKIFGSLKTINEDN